MNFFASIKRVLGGEANFFLFYSKKELLCIGVRNFVFFACLCVLVTLFARGDDNGTSADGVESSSSSVKASSSSAKVASSSSEYVPFDHSNTLAGDWRIGENRYKTFVDPRNGRIYYYITITSDYTGKSVTVMAENLNIGEMDLGENNQNDDPKIERCCCIMAHAAPDSRSREMKKKKTSFSTSLLFCGCQDSNLEQGKDRPSLKCYRERRGSSSRHHDRLIPVAYGSRGSSFSIS